MIGYIVRRALWGLALLLIVSFLTFAIFYLLPSADPAALRAGRSATPQLVAEIRHQLGLDKPFYVPCLANDREGRRPRWRLHS